MYRGGRVVGHICSTLPQMTYFGLHFLKPNLLFGVIVIKKGFICRFATFLPQIFWYIIYASIIIKSIVEWNMIIID